MLKLSQKEKLILKLQIESELYRRSFYEFFKASVRILYPQVDWDFNWHFEYICDILQAETERIVERREKTKDIIINLPFRSGKSILCSQIYPVWCWLKDNSLAIMQVSHSETLAIKHSHASKMLVESEWFKARFPEIELRQDTHAKANYMTSGGGKRISFGVNSGIIGEGCSIQLIDDINNPQDSLSVTASINEVYTDTLYSRLNNASIDIRIILQQRVAENDICGFLLNKNPNQYMHICIPAKITTNISPINLVEYYQDGLFWKKRFSEKVLLDYQSTLGSRAFYGQLMQKPQSEEGTLIKRNWIKTITLDELSQLIGKQKVNWEVFVDSAYTKSTSNDATAIIVAAKINNSLYVLKAWNLWMEFPELILQLKTIRDQFDCRLIHIESKASGLSIIQQLRRDGFNVAELKPKDKDKISRTNAVTPTIEGGRVYFVIDSWNEMVLQQLSGFPFGADDLVDVLVYAIDTLLNKQNFSYGLL
jgi:predicted phage terminase large subunit-like protein